MLLLAFMCLFHCMKIPAFGQECEAPPDFATFCVNNHRGVVNGGRCFFLASAPGFDSALIGDRNVTKSSWANAFAVCQAQNAMFAQIHTSSELKAIGAAFSDILDKPSSQDSLIWIAAKQDPQATPEETLDFTNWYDENEVADSRLTGRSTYFRLHKGDLGNENVAPYIQLYTSDGLFADLEDVYQLLVLCAKYTRIQNYALVKDKCMNETVIESFSQPAWSWDCINACSQRVWCRSFNLRLGGTKCDLFSWHASDTSNVASVTDVSDCAHYDYVP